MATLGNQDGIYLGKKTPSPFSFFLADDAKSLHIKQYYIG
jgi:hypothetical protein